MTGKYQNGARPAGSRGTINKDLGGRLQPLQEAPVKAYLELAAAHGIDPAKLAIAFCLTRPFMASVIIGAQANLFAEISQSLNALMLAVRNAGGGEVRVSQGLYPIGAGHLNVWEGTTLSGVPARFDSLDYNTPRGGSCLRRLHGAAINGDFKGPPISLS